MILNDVTYRQRLHFFYRIASRRPMPYDLCHRLYTVLKSRSQKAKLGWRIFSHLQWEKTSNFLQNLSINLHNVFKTWNSSDYFQRFLLKFLHNQQIFFWLMTLEISSIAAPSDKMGCENEENFIYKLKSLRTVLIVINKTLYLNTEVLWSQSYNINLVVQTTKLVLNYLTALYVI